MNESARGDRFEELPSSPFFILRPKKISVEKKKPYPYSTRLVSQIVTTDTPAITHETSEHIYLPPPEVCMNHEPSRLI